MFNLHDSKWLNQILSLLCFKENHLGCCNLPHGWVLHPWKHFDQSPALLFIIVLLFQHKQLISSIGGDLGLSWVNGFSWRQIEVFFGVLRFLRTDIFLPQVHFVPESSTVAQIVYTDEQDRLSQQVVYAADGTSYTSVDGAEHTLVYIHQADGTQVSWVWWSFQCLWLCGNWMFLEALMVVEPVDRSGWSTLHSND